MEAQNKSSTDAHRCSSELWQVDAEMLGVVPGKGFGGSTLSARVAPFLYNGSLQTKAECYFHFLSFFFHKSENSIWILSVNENKHLCSSLAKMKW